MTSILIVDDEPTVRTLITAILGKQGYDCENAADAAAAKNILSARTFDLLLTDLNMPGESGLDLIKYTKEHYPRMATSLVTVADDPIQAKIALELGLDGYIVKPFTSNVLIILIDNALRHNRQRLAEQQLTRYLQEEVALKNKYLDEQLYFLQTLIDAIPAPVYYKNTKMEYLGCNKAFEVVVDRNRDDILGKTAWDIHKPELARELIEKDQELLMKGGIQVHERVVVTHDGTDNISLLHKAAFHDSEGKIAGLVGVGFDISELKKTEQSLRLSEEKLRSIMDNLPVGIILVSPQLELLQANKQMKSWFPHITENFQEFFNSIMHGCKPHSLEEKRLERTVKLAAAEGDRFFQISQSPVIDDRGRLSATIKAFEDITEQLEVERELRQAQKLESIGQLAAGIAHEINTPMQYLGDNIHFLQDAFTDINEAYGKFCGLRAAMRAGRPIEPFFQETEAKIEEVELDYLLEEIPKTIQQSLEGVDRVSVIVRAMRDFSHPGSDEKMHTDINRALESTIIVSKNTWKYVAEVKTSFTPDIPTLLCLPGEMNQVFLNLIINAAHAIEEVAASSGRKGKGLISVSTRISGHFLEIEIADTGGGIPDTIKDRVFDPFFTTKQVGKGTGQGLAIARNVIVDKHQGQLYFDSVPGRGTIFTIKLPL